MNSNLTRAAFVYAKARAERKSPRELFSAIYPRDAVVPYVFDKEAAPLGTTTGGGFAAELVQNAVGEFLGSLAPLSAAAALMRGPNALTVDVTNTVNAWKLPLRSTSPAAPTWVSEGAPIQARSGALGTVDLGPSRKLGSIVVMSREAMKRTDADRVFNTILREDAAKGIDAAVFSVADGNGPAIAGLLNGAPTTTGYGGGDEVAMFNDLDYLVGQVAAAGSGQVIFVASPIRAAKMSLRTSIRGTFLPSLAVPDDRLVAVDPLALAWGADSEPGLEVSNQALVHMEDDPAPISTPGEPPTAATPVRSVWQTDAIATRLLLDIAFAKRAAASVAYVDGVTW